MEQEVQAAVAEATVAQAAPPAPVASLEGVAPQPEVKPAEDLDLSRRFAALTRKEKAILDRERQIKDMMAEPTYKEYETFKQLKADPRRNATKLVESLGVPLSDFYNDLTSLVLNEGKPSVEMELQILKKQMEDDRQARENERLEAGKREETEAVENYKRQIMSEIDTNSDAFELMTAYKDDGSIDLALQVAEQTYMKTGEIISAKEACEAVEKHYEAMARKILQAKKLGLGKAQVENESASPIAAAIKASVAPSKTLTNQASVASVAAPPSEQAPMDPEARLRWTVQKLRQQTAAKPRP